MEEDYLSEEYYIEYDVDVLNIIGNLTPYLEDFEFTDLLNIGTELG